MPAGDRFDHLLADLYGGALSDARWVSAATLIQETIGTNGTSLTYVDLGAGIEPRIHLARFFVGKEQRDDLQQLYFRDYYWRDEAIPRLRGLCDGDLAHKSDLYTDEEKRKSPTYNEFRLPNNTEGGLYMALDGLDGSAVVCSFGNSTEGGGWTHDQIEAIERLGPHIRQFARVRRVLADARALGASLTRLLENGRSGFIQLDRRGRILEANDRARGILLRRDGLGDERGVLHAENRSENEKLGCLLAQALPPYGAQGTGGSMKVTRRKARTPLVVEVHPVRPAGHDSRARKVGALVLVSDPAARPPVDPDVVAEVLGLTPAESRVALAVTSGQTVAGTAHALDCAENTVKTHLKHVYRKLGIRKQSELVRRVMSLGALPRSLS